MEIYKPEQDITVLCVTATSFPAGITAAHEALHAKLDPVETRRFFGISRPEQDRGIIYKAAAEELYEGEAEKYNCERFVIRKGNYISIVIHDYMKDLQSISNVFNQLTNYPGIDPEGYCIEDYISQKDVRCMIKLAE